MEEFSLDDLERIHNLLKEHNELYDSTADKPINYNKFRVDVGPERIVVTILD